MTNHPENGKESLIERLQALTIDNEITWKMYYGQQQNGGMQAASQPNGFIADDNVHGFGVVTLRLHDQMEEIHGGPELYIQGNAVDADEQELYILLDAVQAQIDERRQGGGGLTPEQRFQKRLNKELQPYKEENENLREALAQEKEEKQRLLGIVDRLVDQSETEESDEMSADAFLKALRAYHAQSDALPQEVDVQAVQTLVDGSSQPKTEVH